MNPIDTEAFRRLIDNHCIRAGKSRSAISRAAGSGTDWLKNIINGHTRSPDPGRLRALADQIDVPFETLAECFQGNGGNTVSPEARDLIRIGSTLADALTAIEQGDLKPDKKTEITRDVERLCRNMLNRESADIPADPVWLRHKMDSWNGAKFGITDKRLSNIRGSLRLALEAVQAIPQNRKPIRNLSKPWKDLYDAIPFVAVTPPDSGMETAGKAERPKRKRHYITAFLSPFIRFCDAHGIAPEDVDDNTVRQYADYRHQYDLADGIERKITKTRTAWNKAINIVPGWPHRELSAGLKKKGLNLDWSEFPASFHEDVLQYQENHGMRNWKKNQTKTLLGRARARRGMAVKSNDKMRQGITPLAPRTLTEHINTLRFMASAAVRIGEIQPEEITSIADVADVGLVAAVIEEDIAPRLGLRSAYAGNLVKIMASVAHRWMEDITSEELDDFSALKSEVEKDVDKNAMSKRDRERLAQFDDERNLARLVSLPLWVIERAENVRKSDRAIDPMMALDVQSAIMALLEETLPVRLTTLSITEIDRNLVWPARPGLDGTLQYDADQTKQNRAITAALLPWKVRLLKTYIRHYRPVLCSDRGTPYLFPGMKPGTSKTRNRVSTQLRRFIHDWLGLEVNTHLWRKILGAKLLMETQSIEHVEGLLGHTRGSSATRLYAEIKSKWSAQILDNLLHSLISGHLPRDLPLPARRWLTKKDGA